MSAQTALIPGMGYEVDILCEKIARIHLAYLSEEETPNKLVKCQQIEDYIFEFLFLVPHKKKFKAPAFAEILQRSVESPNFSGHKAAYAFSFIEKYASNLVLQPWRKEYKVINMFGGFYKHNIAKTIPLAHVIFTLMGYKRNRNSDSLILSGPIDPDKLSRVSLDCLVASLECRVMIEIAQNLSSAGWSWKDIYNVRKDNVCDVKSAVQLLSSRIRQNSSAFSTQFVCPTKCDNLIDFQIEIDPSRCLPNSVNKHKTSDSICIQTNSAPANPKKSPKVVNSTKSGSPKAREKSWMESHQEPNHAPRIPSKLKEDKSVRPKIRNPKPEGKEKPKENFDGSVPRVADLSWDYVYQELDKQGYSKDLGERGDVLEKKVRAQLTNGLGAKERLTKTTSVPNKYEDILKPKKKTEFTVQSDGPDLRKDDLLFKKIPAVQVEFDRIEVDFQKDQCNLDTVLPNSKDAKDVKRSPSMPKKSSDSDVNTNRVSKKVLNKSWSCCYCTYLNGPGVEVCEMCSRSRNRGSEVEPLVSGGRECPTCTLVNEKNVDHCTACETNLKDSPTYI